MTKDNIVKVDTSDELASVIDKIVTSESRVVFLIIADDSYIAQNVLNLRLIKRESESVDKEVIVISENPRIQNLATKASLKVKERMDEDVAVPVSGGNRYTREVTDILPPVRKQEPGEFATDLRNTRSSEASDIEEVEHKKHKDDKEQEVSIKYDFSEESPDLSKEELRINKHDPDKEKKIKSGGIKRLSLRPLSLIFNKVKKVFSFKFFEKQLRVLALIIVIAVIWGLGYLVTSVLPKATIILNPYTVKDEMNFTLIADSNISSAEYVKGVIPAQILEEKKEETFTYNATGSAQLEEFAIGTLRIYNEFSSSIQTLVANTRLMSSEGKLFRTVETIVIPGANINGGKIIANSIEVGVRADEAGQDYNIEPATFSIPGFRGDPKFLAFYGKSEESMVGGYRGVATVPTEEDIENAKTKINDEYLPELEKGLRGKVPDNLIILEESFDARVNSLNIDANVGEPKEQFTVKFVGTAQVFLIQSEDVINAISYNFINSTEYSKDFELSEDRTIEYIVKEADYEKGYAEVSVKVSQRFNRIVDANDVLEEVKGKDEIEVRRILSSNEALQRAQVRFWPFWVKAVPDDNSDIEIKVEYKIGE